MRGSLLRNRSRRPHHREHRSGRCLPAHGGCRRRARRDDVCAPVHASSPRSPRPAGSLGVSRTPEPCLPEGVARVPTRTPCSGIAPECRSAMNASASSPGLRRAPDVPPAAELGANNRICCSRLASWLSIRKRAPGLDVAAYCCVELAEGPSLPAQAVDRARSGRRCGERRRCGATEPRASASTRSARACLHRWRVSRHRHRLGNATRHHCGALRCGSVCWLGTGRACASIEDRNRGRPTRPRRVGCRPPRAAELESDAARLSGVLFSRRLAACAAACSGDPA